MRQAVRGNNERSGKVVRGRPDPEQEDVSRLREHHGRHMIDGPDAHDGPATRRVRVPIARLANQPTAAVGSSLLVAAPAAVIRDAMAKDRR